MYTMFLNKITFQSIKVCGVAQALLFLYNWKLRESILSKNAFWFQKLIESSKNVAF